MNTINCRLVHSVDFYNRSEYMNEDDMPNRCGIFHLRGKPGPAISTAEIEKINLETSRQLEKLLKAKVELSDEEVNKLGFKNERDEVEKFLAANCQELAKDKWLCPLSGKKFKAPEFVRKHIFNKHGDLIEEVKVETAYFNKYLRDPNRPELPATQAPVKPKKAALADSREILLPARRVPVRERLGGPVTLPGVKVTHAVKDPRDIVDYSDIDLSTAFDIF